MYALGHLGTAALAVSPIAAALVARRRERLAVGVSVVTIGLTVVPDFDVLVPWTVHRGFSHTVAFAVFVGVVAGAAAGERALHRGSSAVEHGAWGAVAGTLSVLVHLGTDAVTPMGIRPFAPLSGAHYTLDLVPAADSLANGVLFAAGVLSLGAAWNAGALLRGPEPTAREVLRETLRSVLPRGSVRERGPARIADPTDDE